MKKISLLFCAFCLHAALGQKPETVHSFVRERHKTSWYELQQKLWKAEIDKNKTNGEAWYNYYRATRALALYAPSLETDPVVCREMNEKYVALYEQIVEVSYKAVPESYEANLMKYESSSYETVKYLLKAYEIDPTDVRSFDALMTHYETEQNEAEFAKFAGKMYQYNVLPASLLSWGYNVLSEMDEKAILFTAGDNDTYACWIVQQVKNVRKDVQVINTYMIRQDTYRNRLFKKMGIAPLDLVFKNDASPEEQEKNFRLIVEHLKKSKYPVYVSVTAVHDFQQEMENELFLTGLAYKFSAESFDNTAIIRRNYEKKYLLDHLKQHFSFNIGDKISDELNSMYLPSMLKLYKSYRDSEEREKMKALEELILMVSERSGQKEQVLEALKD